MFIYNILCRMLPRASLKFPKLTQRFHMKLLVLATAVLSATFLFAAVDINNASKEELMTLKGLGEKKADAVLEYRKQNCFKNVEALSEVKGLGPKFIENNKKELQAGKCQAAKK